MGSEKIKISVIIPASENCKILAIRSLKEQEKNIFEIIVVRGKNTSKNRNDGIRKARGDIIAFVNAHCILPQNWSKNILNFFKKYPKIDIVGGPQLTSEQEGLFGKASGIALSSIFGAANVSKRYNGKKIKFRANETDITSANLACRKKIFKKIKFDENIYPGEDPKFISDANKNNMKIAYTPNIFCYNKRRDNFNGLFKQIFNYGKVRPKKESFFQTLKNPMFFIPSLFVLGMLLALFLSIFHSKHWIILLDSYIILNLIFSSYESFKNKHFTYFFILPWIFFIIHISYGLGMLWGYIKKL